MRLATGYGADGNRNGFELRGIAYADTDKRRGGTAEQERIALTASRGLPIRGGRVILRSPVREGRKVSSPGLDNSKGADMVSTVICSLRRSVPRM